MNTEEMIKVMQAYVDGEEIEYTRSGKDWRYSDDPEWDWSLFEYRIKPKPRTIWVNEHEDNMETWYTCYNSKKDAEHDAYDYGLIRTAVEYQEVMK